MRNQEDRSLVQVVIEDPDPTARSAAHRELARRAASRDDLPKAVCHYREAAELDPTDEVAKEALAALKTAVVTPRRGVLGRIVRGLSRSRASAA